MMKFLHNMKLKVLNPNNHGFILLLIVILLLPNLFVTFLSYDLSGNLFKKVAYLAFSMLILLLPALFLKLRYYFLLESIFMIMAPFEMGYVWISGSTSTDGYISSLLNTNFVEATEILSTAKVMIVLLLFIWAAYFYIVFRKIKNNYLFTKNSL